MKLNDKIPYFAKIYNLDEKKLRYEQEYIPYMLKDKCPNNWKEQLNDFNNLLKKYGYFIDDVHSKNLAPLNLGPSPQISFILPLSFASLL